MDQFLTFGGTGGHGFLNEHALARLEQRFRHGVVESDRGRNRHRAHHGVRDQAFEFGLGLYPWKTGSHVRKSRGIRITNSLEIDPVQTGEIPNEIRPPVSTTNDSYV